jgi:putative ABC transport system permease protein
VPVRLDGRDRAPATVDQPKLTQGSWVRDGGAVVEAAFAHALGVNAGDRISLRYLDLDLASKHDVAGRLSRSFRVVGVAVTAAAAPYPEVSCLSLCPGNVGQVWLTRADAAASPAAGSVYVMNLRLADRPSAGVRQRAQRAPRPTADSPRPCPSARQPWQEISARAPTWWKTSGGRC